uniref:Expansin-like EG45 domain-containing protein n=1 Tax=Kalanchoe fedtschenkoi TaxID=63787 RepID=A0A7N0ZZQ4_KALFE
MFKLVRALLLISVAELLLPCSRADIGAAAHYSPPYLPTACYGGSSARFPTNNLFGAAGEGVWDNGGACGRQYLVRCISAAVPGTCIQGVTIQIKIVDQATTSKSRPSAPNTAFVLSTTAFSAIANLTASSINIEFQEL